MQDRLDSIETELAGHSAFGDAQSIFDRVRAVVLLFLKGAAKGRPLIQALHQELRDGPHRQAAAILADPVVRAGMCSLLDAFRRDRGSRFDEFEELFAATLRHLRNGAPGPPTAAGCRLHARPHGVPHDIALWDPALPQPVFKRSFESAFNEFIACDYLPDRVRLRRSSPAFVEAVERGCGLLATLLPELAASALAHLRLIGAFSVDDCRRRAGQTTHLEIASTVFVYTGSWQTPWQVAEALLHEAMHCKMADLSLVRDIWQEGGDAEGSLVISPFWRRGERKRQAEWPPTRAFAAFHVYVHLALFCMRVERLKGQLAGEFGPPPASFPEVRTSLDRAAFLRRALEERTSACQLGSEGRLMFAWLSETLQRLSDSA